jgi:hypothetical protein
MGLSSGGGRAFRWYGSGYGYWNTSLRATIPFGVGVYYTEFSATVKPSGEKSAPTVAWTFDVTIKNLGTMASRCRTIVFVRLVTIDKSAPRPLPVKTIADFGGTSVLAPGASDTVTLSVLLDSLALTDCNGKRAAYEGKYEAVFTIGNGTVATEPIAVAATTVVGQLPPPPPMMA